MPTCPSATSAVRRLRSTAPAPDRPKVAKAELARSAIPERSALTSEVARSGADLREVGVMDARSYGYQRASRIRPTPPAPARSWDSATSNFVVRAILRSSSLFFTIA
jgi:hypothetical protein